MIHKIKTEMTKADRDKVFNKYSGHCAYCGCELQKGWHVDHIQAVVRKFKAVYQHWKHVDTGEILEQNDGLRLLRNMPDRDKWEYIKRKEVPDGFTYPENDTPENSNPACHSCNITKATLGIEGFRQYVQNTVESLNKNKYAAYKFAKRYGLIQETGIEVKFYFETQNK